MIDPHMTENPSPISLPLKGLSLEQLKQQLALVRTAIAKAKDDQKYAFFEPNGAQERFVHMLGYYRPFVGIFSAANGVGKTALASNIAANIIFGPQSPAFANFDLFKNWPYPRRARYITDPKLVEEIGPWHSECSTWWPKGKYEVAKAGKQWYSLYRTNRWILDVMTYDQALKDFEGSTLGLAMFDEPPPEGIWNATVSRMRKGGLILVFMTPLTGAAWFFDRIVPKHPNSIIYADIEENCVTHGKNGQLKHEDIQRMINEMPADEVEARAHGRAMALAYLIYKSFDRRVHVPVDPIVPPPGAQVWQIVDPHIDKPWASIWGYPSGDGTFTQFAEWPDEDFYAMHQNQMGLDDYKQAFAAKEKNLHVEKRIIDRHFAQVRNHINKRTLFEELEAIGLSYEPSYHVGGDEKEIETGILKVRSYLAYNPEKPVDGANRPKYIVSPTCHNTIKGFERWAMNPKNMQPSDAYKDYMDCVRYAVMAQPQIVHVPARKEPRNIFG